MSNHAPALELFESCSIVHCVEVRSTPEAIGVRDAKDPVWSPPAVSCGSLRARPSAVRRAAGETLQGHRAEGAARERHPRDVELSWKFAAEAAVGNG